MKKIWALAAWVVLVSPLVFAEIGETYIGLGGEMLLPQGGARIGRRVAGGAIRLGAELGDYYSIEAEVGWLEQEATVAVQEMVHFAIFAEYDKLFGYSRFDPFFTVGIRDWMGSETQVGPKVGLGALYYLSDDWALRSDFEAMLGVEGEVEVDWTIGMSIQYSF